VLMLVLERDVRNQAGIADFWISGIKTQRIQYSNEGNNVVYYDDS
jgi:hypothetical protein